MHEILIDSVERPFRGSVHALLLVIPRDYAVNFSLKLLPPRLRLISRQNRDFLEELVVDSVVVQQHSDQFIALSRDSGPPFPLFREWRIGWGGGRSGRGER